MTVRLDPVFRLASLGIDLAEVTWDDVRSARVGADPLMPLFDPARTRLDGENSVAFVGLKHIDAVLTGGVVLRRCPDGLGAAMRDMSLFADRRVPGEFALLDGDPALLEVVRGRVAVIGAVWRAPHAGHGILRALWPVLVAEAIERLRADWIVGLIRGGRHCKLGYEIEGFRHFWEGLHYRDPDWGGGFQVDDFTICAMSRREAEERVLGRSRSAGKAA